MFSIEMWKAIYEVTREALLLQGGATFLVLGIWVAVRLAGRISMSRSQETVSPYLRAEGALEDTGGIMAALTILLFTATITSFMFAIGKW